MRVCVCLCVCVCVRVCGGYSIHFTCLFFLTLGCLSCIMSECMRVCVCLSVCVCVCACVWGIQYTFYMLVSFDFRVLVNFRFTNDGSVEHV